MSDHEHHLGHDDAARTAATEAHDAVDEARDTAAAAVAEARAGLAATTASLETLTPLPALLQRHYHLGLIAVATGMVVGFGLLMLFLNLRNSQEEQRRIQQAVNIQTKANEVAEIRGQVTTREGDYRLCVVALGASRPPGVAEKICEPVLGEDYTTLMAKLQRLERGLLKARNGG